jgi:hypothetical protein
MSELSDLEITRKCAEAMGIQLREDVVMHAVLVGSGHGHIEHRPRTRLNYNPLQDDAQAMALVKKFRLDITTEPLLEPRWEVWQPDASRSGVFGSDVDLNRAICLCICGIMDSSTGEKHDAKDKD